MVYSNEIKDRKRIFLQYFVFLRCSFSQNLSQSVLLNSKYFFKAKVKLTIQKDEKITLWFENVSLICIWVQGYSKKIGQTWRARKQSYYNSLHTATHIYILQQYQLHTINNYRIQKTVFKRKTTVATHLFSQLQGISFDSELGYLFITVTVIKIT